MNANTVEIIVQGINYEEHITEIFLYVKNGYWSGSLTIYPSEEHWLSLCETMIQCGKVNAPPVEYALGDAQDSKYAYYLHIFTTPSNGWGGLELNFQFVDRLAKRQDHSANFSIACTSTEINALGKIFKKSFLEYTIERWTKENSW